MAVVELLRKNDTKKFSTEPKWIEDLPDNVGVMSLNFADKVIYSEKSKPAPWNKIVKKKENS